LSPERRLTENIEALIKRGCHAVASYTGGTPYALSPQDIKILAAASSRKFWHCAKAVTEKSPSRAIACRLPDKTRNQISLFEFLSAVINAP
jgi:hypothetical protein